MKDLGEEAEKEKKRFINRKWLGSENKICGEGRGGGEMGGSFIYDLHMLYGLYLDALTHY